MKTKEINIAVLDLIESDAAQGVDELEILREALELIKSEGLTDRYLSRLHREEADFITMSQKDMYEYLNCVDDQTAGLDERTIIQWPESQKFMSLEGWPDKYDATLINESEELVEVYGPSAYLIRKCDYKDAINDLKKLDQSYE